MNQNELTEGLGWLSELAFPPETNPATVEGERWMRRLTAEMLEIRPTGEEWIAACRHFNRKGGSHPTTGELAQRVKDDRLARTMSRREIEWEELRRSRIEPGEGLAPRAMVADYAHVLDLVRRGFDGPGYLDRVREEQRTGERRHYAPSLEAPGNPVRRLVGGAL